MEMSEIKDMQSMMEYIMQEFQDKDKIAIMLALGIAAVVTYIIFYTDTVEAGTAALGDLPGTVLHSEAGSGLVSSAISGAAAVIPK